MMHKELCHVNTKGRQVSTSKSVNTRQCDGSETWAESATHMSMVLYHQNIQISLSVIQNLLCILLNIKSFCYESLLY